MDSDLALKIAEKIVETYAVAIFERRDYEYVDAETIAELIRPIIAADEIAT